MKNLEKISAFVINYLDELLTSMHLEVKMVAKFHNDQIIINMDSNNNAILIGKDGRTLKALQMVVCLTKRIIINKNIFPSNAISHAFHPYTFVSPPIRNCKMSLQAYANTSTTRRRA